MVGVYNFEFGVHIIALLALVSISISLPMADGAFTATPSSIAIGSTSSHHLIHEMKPKSSSNMDCCEQDESLPSLNRRQAFLGLSFLPLIHPTKARANENEHTETISRGKVFEIEDPNTFSAVVYIPPAKKNRTPQKEEEGVESFPLLVVLHGAGKNKHSALYEFTQGDHTNLPPYLLSTNQAPPSLSENFVVVAPYAGKDKQGSLYDEPRSKILSFLKWFNAWLESQTQLEDNGTTSKVAINRQRVSLFGFSEGSTLAVELATTRQFNGVVLASYGFTGILPKMAVERLQGIPIWVFHSKGDDIYDIQCSNQLVESLLAYENVKYTKLIGGDAGAGIKGREHVRATLVASKSDEVYSWLLSLK